MTNSKLTLCAGDIKGLTRYVVAQLHSIFPNDSIAQDEEILCEVVPRSLERIRPILESVRLFENNIFNHFNSLQYATFLYLLGNDLWKMQNEPYNLADRLFYLNKTLNCIDLFYKVSMPEIFFISHGSGAVLGKASYGNRLVLFQNVTVGRVGDNSPVIGRNVVLYTGSTVTGKSIIGDNSVVSAGVVVHNISVPDNVIVVNEVDGLAFKPLRKDYTALYFHNHDT